MIKAIGLSKAYDNRQVVDNINLSFDDGKFYSIIGQSGSGKSTLLYLLSGLETKDCGEVEYNNIKYNDLSEKEMFKLRAGDYGFVFQFYNLIPNITVFDNIAMPLFMKGKKKKEIIAPLMKLCERLGLEEFLKKFPTQLSGGEQQRVAIARALINEPKILFADEPTGNLDSKTGAEVINLLLELQKELAFTMIMVTHNNDLAKLADVQIEIEDGKIKSVETNHE